MRLHRMKVLAAPFLMAAACSSDPTGLQTTRDTAIMVDDLAHSSWPTDRITVDSARMTAEGRLKLFTTYGGGCQTHAAALLVDRAFMESQPPQLRTRLAHNAKNDACDAIIFWTLEFSLHPVRDHYRQSYGPGPGSVVLNVGGHNVTYSFE